MDEFVRTRKLAAVRDAEARGEVSDSVEVRTSLINRLDAGELTLAQVKAELKRIKRCAKRSGKITRAQAFIRG